MDRGFLYIIASVVAVFVIVIGVKVAIDSTVTTGIDLNWMMSFARPAETPANPG